MDACYQTYLGLCRPFEFSAPWDCLKADPHAYRGPADPSVILPLLSQRYPEPMLIAAGLAQRDGRGQLQLHPWLTIPDVPLVALRDQFNGTVVNLMTLGGCLTGDERPLFGVFADHHTIGALEGSRRQLLLTSSVEDAILLRSVGLAAAPITGLDALNEQGLQLLHEIFGIERELSRRELEDLELEDAENEAEPAEIPPAPSAPGGGEQAAPPRPSAPAAAASASQAPSHPYLIPGSGDFGPDADDGVPLTIVGWSPGLLSLAEPESVRRAVQYLHELRTFRHVSLFNLDRWLAAAAEVQALRFALERGEPGWVKDALLDSLRASTRSLADPQHHALTAPNDFATAVEQLQAVLLGDSEGNISRSQQRQALLMYHRLAAKQFIGPMLRQAEAASDPVERSLRLHLAQLNTLFLEKMPAIREQILRGGSQPAASSPELGHQKSISELLAISSQLLTIAKEVNKCYRHPSPPSKRPARTLTINAPRFANSELVSRN